MSKKKHVYILLQFYKLDTRVLGVYTSKLDAWLAARREMVKNPVAGGTTHGIIKKTVRGVFDD